MITTDYLDTLEPQQMRAALLSLMGELAERDGVIARQGQEVVFKQALIDKLTHENALLKRMKFAAQSERFSTERKSLLDESLDEDLQAVADEIEHATQPVAGCQDKQVPKRALLPANLPRREIRHEPESTTCACGCQMVDALRVELLQHRVLHADETPVAMLKPGNGKTHRAYLWAYATGAFEMTKAVVYDFCESRAGEHARTFLGDWKGSLVCDDFSGYKALLAAGVTEVGCLAHARRKFFDLQAANQSQIAQIALEQMARIYEIEREVKELSAEQRLAVRRERAKPLLDALHEWMTLQRRKVPDGSATAKALDYSLKRWAALIRFADDGQLPVDNNWIENQIRPIAIGRNNWLFAGSLRAGQRAAAVMSLIQSARMSGHDPWAYIDDVLRRLPTQPNSRIAELLPHHWQRKSRAA
ncbi:IS66 family transposase [Hydrogenophaga sp. RAC07]|uniref:IS66 family transposase n=1 Tax=Hydrogenophaga sp. RAC07 TaxID=1842537 RepID=UPI0012EAC8AA|nr:IS66 family transposase [Hydrogenophaga sp. RAC07]